MNKQAIEKLISDFLIKRELQQQNKRLIDVQTDRIHGLIKHFGKNDAAILADPVGSGKTLVTLCAIHGLINGKTISKAVIVAPNATVKKKWETEGDHLGIKAGVTYITRREISDTKIVKQDICKTLIVIDEAHRSFQNKNGKYYQSLSEKIVGAKVLLVTATPMQLSAQRLVHMLSIALKANNNSWQPLLELGEKLKNVFSVARRDYQRVDYDAKADLSNHVIMAAKDAGTTLKKAKQCYEQCFLLPAYPRNNAGIPSLPKVTPNKIDLSSPWETAYHIARIMPELVDTGKGDMFHRRLISSSEAFLKGKAGQELDSLRNKHKKIKALKDELAKQLIDNPKFNALIKWCNTTMKERHILIFCVFNETQKQLADKLRSENDVFAPEDASALSGSKNEAWIKGFRSPVINKNTPRRILIVKDNLSESIDLDGGSPCIVHYDLAWNPVRLQQRYGRVVRASSNFTPVKPEDIWIPYLDVEVDRRMAETLHGRAGMADLLLPTETDSLDGDAPADDDGEELDDHIWSIDPKILEIIKNNSE